jgi:hypothetical protein
MKEGINAAMIWEMGKGNVEGGGGFFVAVILPPKNE